MKNTVFLDLFSLPKYRLQMFQTLHPKMTDVTADDIVPPTFLAFLVRDKLIIFVEAQSTWSINILVRILLYLAMTYQEYIIDRDMNVYSPHKLAMPEPVFYVIYTGPNAKLDLQIKVIHAENKGDVIGQYIIFCHVMDEQIRLYGRKKKAAEEAIRICQDTEVLKKYLDGRKKEVISIMMILFAKDYAMKAVMREYGKLPEIYSLISYFCFALELCDYLIKNGVDIYAMDDEGLNALDHARQHRMWFENIKELLMKAMNYDKVSDY